MIPVPFDLSSLDDEGLPADLVVVGITALNTWAAFSEKGSLGTFVSDDDDAERDRPKPFL